MRPIIELISGLRRAEQRRAELIRRQAPPQCIALETANIRNKVARLRFVVAVGQALAANPEIAKYAKQTDAELAA